MVRVAKVVIQDAGGRYLLLVRANHPRFGDDPDLPGGTAEGNEDAPTAAVREVFEETGIALDATMLRFIYQGNDYSQHGTEYTLYAVQLDSHPEVTISWEHRNYRWVSRAELLTVAGSAADTYMRMVAHELVRGR